MDYGKGQTRVPRGNFENCHSTLIEIGFDITIIATGKAWRFGKTERLIRTTKQEDVDFSDSRDVLHKNISFS